MNHIIVKIIDYFDVWGNPKDGFDVNNLCQWQTDFYIDPSILDSKKTLLSWLRSVGYLKPGNGLNALTVTDYHPYYEIERRRTGEPVCRIEVIE
jgi:hypothetical protein